MSCIRALVIGLSWLPISCIAQDGGATLTGEVLDITGAKVAHTKAELYAQLEPAKVYRTTADDHGVYRFTGLTAGEYALKLFSPGFKELRVKSIGIVDGRQKLMPALELTTGLTCGAGGPAFDYFRFLPSGNHVGNLGGSVRLDLGR